MAGRRRKRGSTEAQRYELQLMDNIRNTAWARQQGCFKPSRSVCFIATRPKAHEIHAAAFVDRVVHRLPAPRPEAFHERIFQPAGTRAPD